MRRKKERSKQGQTNKQGKATQHTQGSHFMYVQYAFSCDNIYRIRQDGASNADVSHDLVPLLASTSATLDRVFPSEDVISEVSKAFYIMHT